MRAAVGNGGWEGDPDMTALRRLEAQAAPGYAKITDLNCSCLALMGDGSAAVVVSPLAENSPFAKPVASVRQHVCAR
jgi:hypothetical protein